MRRVFAILLIGVLAGCGGSSGSLTDSGLDAGQPDGAPPSPADGGPPSATDGGPPSPAGGGPPGAIRPDQADLFWDSFESGDGSAWFYESPGSSYSSLQCHSGNYCGAKTPPANMCQQTEDWVWRNTNYTGSEWYLKSWWRFPVGFVFTQSNVCPASADWKALILETATGDNRCFLNFRGGSKSDRKYLAFICEKTGEDWANGSGAEIVADGQWHSIELHVTRTAGGGHVQAWYDGKLFIDQPRIICSGACPFVDEVKFGAYINYALTQQQTFYLDDVSISTQRVSD